VAEETFVVDSSGKATILKDPDAILDYTFDWTQWLAAASVTPDTIATAVGAVSGAVTAAINSTSHDAQKVTLWVSGGAAGEKIVLRCRITTAAGRTDDRTVYLKVKDR
jgi:hypothetical protein